MLIITCGAKDFGPRCGVKAFVELHHPPHRTSCSDISIFTKEYHIRRLCARVQDFLGRDLSHSGVVAQEPALMMLDVGGVMTSVECSKMVHDTSNVPIYTGQACHWGELHARCVF